MISGPLATPLASMGVNVLFWDVMEAIYNRLKQLDVIVILFNRRNHKNAVNETLFGSIGDDHLRNQTSTIEFRPGSSQMERSQRRQRGLFRFIKTHIGHAAQLDFILFALLPAINDFLNGLRPAFCTPDPYRVQSEVTIRLPAVGMAQRDSEAASGSATTSRHDSIGELHRKVQLGRAEFAAVDPRFLALALVISLGNRAVFLAEWQ